MENQLDGDDVVSLITTTYLTTVVVGGDVIRCEIMSKISFLGRISKEMARIGGPKLTHRICSKKVT